jgi:hypothetical protein
MVASFHRPHGDVGPLLFEQSLVVLVDGLWGCVRWIPIVRQPEPSSKV